MGGWADYLRHRQQRLRPAADQRSRRAALIKADWPLPGSQTVRSTFRRKLSFNEQREFDSLPARIEALEEEERRLRAESESGEFYKAAADHIRAVLARLEQNAAEHEAALARWLELEERSGR